MSELTVTKDKLIIECDCGALHTIKKQADGTLKLQTSVLITKKKDVKIGQEKEKSKSDESDGSDGIDESIEPRYFW